MACHRGGGPDWPGTSKHRGRSLVVPIRTSSLASVPEMQGECAAPYRGHDTRLGPGQTDHLEGTYRSLRVMARGSYYIRNFRSTHAEIHLTLTPINGPQIYDPTPNVPHTSRYPPARQISASLKGPTGPNFISLFTVSHRHSKDWLDSVAFTIPVLLSFILLFVVQPLSHF